MATPHQDLFERLLVLVQSLIKEQVEFALIGGMALAARGFPRATKAIDLLIHERYIQSIRHLMHSHGYETLDESDEFSCYLDGRLRFDFQHAHRPISQAMIERAEPIDFGGSRIPVVLAQDVIGLKVQAFANNPRRLQDLVDIQRLIEIHHDHLDLNVIREYFQMFNREADLDATLKLAAG